MESIMLFDSYHYTVIALWVILFTVFVQHVVATAAHRKQAKYIPGIVDEKLGQESFVFRSHRTFMNSLENVPLMFGATLLAIIVGLNPLYVSVLVWVYAIARIIHMILYYKIATEANPSPRSYFFMIAFISNFVLFAMIAVSWF